MRTIGIVTVGRSDYGIYLPVLRRLQADASLRLGLYVTGMHLSPEFGRTVNTIEKDGFDILARIEMLLASDTPEAIAKSVGLGVIGFAQVFSRDRPDLLVVLGDRFEMFAAALAALPFRIPVAHIHGGEVTQGAIDEALRHSITKLSHLHFTSTEEYAQRVRQLGEESWRVHVSGAPSLDNLRHLPLLGRPELETALGFGLETPLLLVTFHPVTLQYEEAAQQGEELFAALEECGVQVVLTMPNADTGGRVLIQMARELAGRNPKIRLVDNLGTARYFSLMRQASAMVGNSSSGIIEAPSFELPVVNIGIRQAGRVRGRNVIDVGGDRVSIQSGIRQALSPAFRAGLSGMRNPYQASREAAFIIDEVLAHVALDERLLLKTFCDMPVSRQEGAHA